MVALNDTLYLKNCLTTVLVQYLNDTFLSLSGAFSLCRCEEHSDEAISVDLAGNEIATPRQGEARNDMEGYYQMLQTYCKVSPIYLN
ncbi:MAG: hypothetical protein WB564_06560 [Dehalococcoidia bacterium]